jgi:hypothetical protein
MANREKYTWLTDANGDGAWIVDQDKQLVLFRVSPASQGPLVAGALNFTHEHLPIVAQLHDLNDQLDQKNRDQAV